MKVFIIAIGIFFIFPVHAVSQNGAIVERSISYNSLLLQSREVDVSSMLNDNLNAEFLQTNISGDKLIKSYFNPNAGSIISIVYEFDKNYQFDRMCKAVSETYFLQKEDIQNITNYLDDRSSFKKASDNLYIFLASENPWISVLERSKILVQLTENFDVEQNKYVFTTNVAFQDYFLKK